MYNRNVRRGQGVRSVRCRVSIQNATCVSPRWSH